MNDITISRPELALVAGTRAALGVGVGLLLANRLNERTRRAVGWTLTIFGGLITIPLAFEILGKREPMVRSMGAPEPQAGVRDLSRFTLEGVPRGV